MSGWGSARNPLFFVRQGAKWQTVPEYLEPEELRALLFPTESGRHMNPLLILLLCRGVFAKIGPDPWNPLAFAPGKHDLKELKYTDVECCNRACQVEAPHPGEVRPESLCHSIVGTLEPSEPMFQSLGIM